MKTIEQWLEAYGESHQNPTNKKVHWICVPSIMFSLIGLLMSIPFPFYEKNLVFNWASVVYLGALLFYLRLSFVIFIGFALIMGAMIWLNLLMFYAELNLPLISLLIFVFAWIGQFWGHKIEGKKPSFLQDIQFLLIGPAWLLHFVLKKAGIRYE
jgi:uncharacterized membrane protein YGL010W